jgi:hypothetical protein
MKTHELRTWPRWFYDVSKGHKRFEVRKNDRQFEVGDELLLREWEPLRKSESNPEPIGYTGAALRARVAYLLHGGSFGLADDHVIMGLEDVRGVFAP